MQEKQEDKKTKQKDRPDRCPVKDDILCGGSFAGQGIRSKRQKG